MAYADEAVHAFIGSLGLDGLTLAPEQLAPFSGNLIRTPEIATEENAPGLAVFVMPGSGGEDEPFIGGAKRHKREIVQVIVRSEPADYSGGLELARSIRSGLHYAAISGYYSVSCPNPQPDYNGRDEDGRHAWSIAVDLRSVS